MVFEYLNSVVGSATSLSPPRLSTPCGSVYRAVPTQRFLRTIFANRWGVWRLQKPGDHRGKIAGQKVLVETACDDPEDLRSGKSLVSSDSTLSEGTL